MACNRNRPWPASCTRATEPGRVRVAPPARPGTPRCPAGAPALHPTRIPRPAIRNATATASTADFPWTGTDGGGGGLPLSRRHQKCGNVRIAPRLRSRWCCHLLRVPLRRAHGLPVVPQAAVGVGGGDRRVLADRGDRRRGAGDGARPSDLLRVPLRRADLLPVIPQAAVLVGSGDRRDLADRGDRRRGAGDGARPGDLLRVPLRKSRSAARGTTGCRRRWWRRSPRPSRPGRPTARRMRPGPETCSAFHCEEPICCQ